MNRSDELAAFVNVVREAGLLAAAKAMQLTPSAVSKQVSRLEDRLNVQLLNRTMRHLSMMQEGETFFQGATAILAYIEEAEALVSDRCGTPSGTLRVTSSITFGRHQQVPMMPEFLKRYPDLRLRLPLSDNVVNLVREGVDVAVRSEELTDSSLVARRLAVDKRVVCAAPSYVENMASRNVRKYSAIIIVW